MSNKFRFDDAYETVYRLTSDGQAYQFACSYLQAGITVKMSDQRKAERAEAYLNAKSLAE